MIVSIAEKSGLSLSRRSRFVQEGETFVRLVWFTNRKLSARIRHWRHLSG